MGRISNRQGAARPRIGALGAFGALGALGALAVLLAFLWLHPMAAWADECPAGGAHDYEAELVYPAGEETEGLRHFTCTKCGDEYDQVIPPTGHTWSAWVREQDPTCVDEGYEYRVCEVCGYREGRVVEPLSDARTHTWAETSRTEPTCEEEGVAHFTCSVCGETRSEALAALGHEWGEWETVRKATEDEPGEERRVCAHDASHVEVRELPKLEAVAEEQPEPEPEPVIEAAPEPESESESESPRSAMGPWEPNALDGVLLGVDVSALAVFAFAAAPLLHLRVWAAAKRDESRTQEATLSQKGGRVL